MGRKCCVFGCTRKFWNKTDRKENCDVLPRLSSCSLHKFPVSTQTDSDLRGEWQERVKNGNPQWVIPAVPFVCSDHFTASDFLEGQNILRRDVRVVPSVFPDVTSFSKTNNKRPGNCRRPTPDVRPILLNWCALKENVQNVLTNNSASVPAIAASNNGSQSIHIPAGSDADPPFATTSDCNLSKKTSVSQKRLNFGNTPTSLKITPREGEEVNELEIMDLSTSLHEDSTINESSSITFSTFYDSPVHLSSTSFLSGGTFFTKEQTSKPTSHSTIAFPALQDVSIDVRHSNDSLSSGYCSFAEELPVLPHTTSTPHMSGGTFRFVEGDITVSTSKAPIDEDTPRKKALKEKINELEAELKLEKEAHAKNTALDDTPRKKKLREEINRLEKDLAETTHAFAKYKHSAENYYATNKALKNKIRNLERTVTRRNKKIQSYTDVIKHLKNEKLVSLEAAEVMSNVLPPGAADLLSRVRSRAAERSESKASSNQYPPSLRAFALTLHFYSPRAYKYVRKNFNNCLPHERTLQSWLGTVNAEPGFSSEGMNAIKIKVNESLKNGKKVKIALSVDDMSLKTHLEFDGRIVTGYVDMGEATVNCDLTQKASSACVYMATCINSSWKVPCGYFLINSLTGADRAELTIECIQKLEDMGAEVEALIFDGHASNITMAEHLGAVLRDIEHIDPSFPNPADPSRKISVLLDAVHMFKLVRNCLGEKKIFYDADGEAVRWQYIEELFQLQTEEGLRLANKLAKKNIDWKQHKMKVRVAVQTLSSSVADAIEYCLKVLKLPQFEGAEATIKFIRMIDELFDILNSSSPVATGFKAPMRPSNIVYRKAFLQEAILYLKGITVTPHGDSILITPRFVGFLGLIVCSLSVEDIYDRIVDGIIILYLLTYKLSQDHAETFFGCVRQRGGWNSNPTCRQFKAAYKSLLIRNEIEGTETGNCVNQDAINILQVSSRQVKMNNYEFEATGSQGAFARYSLSELQSCFSDTTRDILRNEQDYDIPLFPDLSTYTEHVVEYIAGWVVNSLSLRVDCKDCKDSLYADIDDHCKFSFISFKNRGGLTNPSQDVVEICKLTESCYRAARSDNLNSVLARNIPQVVSVRARENSLFSSSDRHVENLSDPAAETNHVSELILAISSKYLSVRLHHETKEVNGELTSSRTRLSRQIIDQHM